MLRHATEKHYMSRLSSDLPSKEPYNCPYCPYDGAIDLKNVGISLRFRS